MLNLLFTVLWGFSSLFAHKFYFSLTQAQYNAENKTVECMMQVFIDDLEFCLTKDQYSPIRYEDPEFRSLAYAYIKKHFKVENNLGQAYPVDFIGVELNSFDQVLIYFEFGGIEPGTKLEMRNDIFIEYIPEQVNLINYKKGSFSKSLMFKKGDSFFKPAH
jgi:hypothetical protein